MRQHWDKLSSQVEALSVRERVIVIATVAVAVLFLWGQFIFSPLQDRYKRATNSISSMANQQSDIAQQMVLLEQRLAEDPNRELRIQREEMREQLEQMKSQIEGRLSGLIAPDKMADVLRSILQEQQKLTLVSLKNLPVAPFNSAEDSSKEVDTALFSHSMEFVVDGEYFDVLEYIKRLESLKGFNWQSLNYDVIDYPRARVTIKISTLSLEEDWIGV